ncbi:MAG: sodium:solute symporter family protein [Acidobacteriota bacterium]|nr:sodium:solute symporter family protein [Acidobacteriota bacterium]MDH3784327.1 sodium:solute symporter family protein [Acidobacteriota bacterium]
MSDTWGVATVCVVYLALSLGVGLWPARRSSPTAAGFVAGDRTLGLVLLYFITGATIFSSFAFLGAPGWAYSRGAAAFYILAYGALGMIPFYFCGPGAARVGRAFGYVTQAEMVADRFKKPSIAFVMAVVSVVAFVPYLALQIQGAGKVLEVVTDGFLPQRVGGALVYSVVLIYVLRSGVLGVGWTNTFQGILMIGLAWGLGLYLPYKLYGGVGPMFEQIAAQRPELLVPPGLTSSGEPWNWGGFTTAVLVSILGFSFWPHAFMKAFTARDEKTIRRTVVLYPTFQIFLVPVFLMGFCGVLFATAPAEPDQILPHLLTNLDLPAIVVGLFCAGALAASMSSGDAMAHAAGSIAVRDGLVTGLGVRLDEEQQRSWIRVAIVLTLVAAYVLAFLYRGSLVALLLFAYGPIVQFAPIVLATLFWRKASANGVLWGLIAGTVTTTFFAIYGDLRPFNLHAGILGLGPNILLLIGLSLVSGRAPDPHEARFVAHARGGWRPNS